MPPAAAAVIGSTGLVGSHIVATLVASGTHEPIHTIGRRAPPASASASASARTSPVVEPDTAQWPAALGALAPPPAAVFSALGTTRAAAGGVEAQWRIDHDANVGLARAARAAGVDTFVFVSSGGTRAWGAAWLPYSRMKNGVEDAVADLAFGHAVILKPGLILGARQQPRPAERVAQAAVAGLGWLGARARDAFGQDAVVIARAAVRAAQLAAEGKAPSRYWVVEAADIVRLGRTEWPGDGGDGGSGAATPTAR